MNVNVEDPGDEMLARSVRAALWRYEPIRALDLDSLQVEARDGIVVLRGIVASEAHSFAAAQLARGVPGVKEVVNQLTTDEALERRIAVALASNPAVRRHRTAVNVVGGVAYLYGVVPTEEDAEAIRRVAADVAGIVGVESRLRVVPPGTPVVLAWQASVEGRPLPKPEESVSPGEVAIAAGRSPRDAEAAGAQAVKKEAAP